MKLRRGVIRDYIDWYGSPYWLTYILARLLSLPRKFSVRGSSISHPVVMRTGTTDLPMYNSIFAAMQYLVPLGREPRFILDCGGNAGYAAVWFANAYPNTLIVTVEPETENYQVLLRNIAAYPNIVPVHGAIWSEDTTLQLIDIGHGHCGFETRDRLEPWVGQLVGTTPAYSIATIIDQFGVDEIDLLKLDIEGAEGAVLGESEAWIGRVNVMAVEFHEDKQPGLQDRFHRRAKSLFTHTMVRGENVFYARTGWAGPDTQDNPWKSIT